MLPMDFWVITIGQYGSIGFLAQFGCYAIAVIRAAWLLSDFAVGRGCDFLDALSLIVSVNIVELIPNSGLYQWTWLMCGALLGGWECAAGSSAPETAPAVLGAAV